jgi:hypothetical protein
MIAGTVTLASAGIAATTTPATEQVVSETDPQTFTTTVETSAIVQETTTLYPTGTRLRNMPLYLLNATPEMEIATETTVPADRSVTVHHQVLLELYATYDGSTFWSENQTLIDEQSVVTTGAVVSTTTINTSSIRSGRLSDVSEETGPIATPRAQIHVITEYRSATYDGTMALKMPIEITQWGYDLITPQTISEKQTTPVVTEAPVPRKMISIPVPAAVAGRTKIVSNDFYPIQQTVLLRGGIGVVLFMIGFIIWGICRQLPTLDNIKQEYYHELFKEWISSGEITESATSEYVHIDSLRSLVDIAIDSRKRVIYDENQRRYEVIDGNTRYRYVEPPLPVGAQTESQRHTSPLLSDGRSSTFNSSTHNQNPLSIPDIINSAWSTATDECGNINIELNITDEVTVLSTDISTYIHPDVLHELVEELFIDAVECDWVNTSVTVNPPVSKSLGSDSTVTAETVEQVSDSIAGETPIDRHMFRIVFDERTHTAHAWDVYFRTVGENEFKLEIIHADI